MRVVGREAPSPGYGVTIRVVTASSATAAGAVLTALDVAESRSEGTTIYVSCDTFGAEHTYAVGDRLGALAGVQVQVQVRSVSDRTFLSHLGGKLGVESKVPICHRDDLAASTSRGWPACPRPSRPTPATVTT